MIIVHDIFVCKPGNAGKLAKLFKEWAEFQNSKTPGHNIQIMTDMTGQWHRVISVSTYESLTAYEEATKQMMADPDTPENKEMAEKFKNMNEMYFSGSREIYKVW